MAQPEATPNYNKQIWDGFNLAEIPLDQRTPDNYFIVKAADGVFYPIPREIVIGERIVGLCSHGYFSPRLGATSHRSAFEVVSLDPAEEIVDIYLAEPLTAGTTNHESDVLDLRAILRPLEVAEIFGVTERTVLNWAREQKLPSWRTLGGHYRFDQEEVLRLSRRSGIPKQLISSN